MISPYIYVIIFVCAVCVLLAMTFLQQENAHAQKQAAYGSKKIHKALGLITLAVVLIGSLTVTVTYLQQQTSIQSNANAIPTPPTNTIPTIVSTPSATLTPSY